MNTIILDFGAGDTCKNDKKIVKDMIDRVVCYDNRTAEIIFKWQLFKHEAPNKKLDLDIFDFAFFYALKRGYSTTASVFDFGSLKFLLGYNPCFIKIACRKSLEKYIKYIPNNLLIYRSVDSNSKHKKYKNYNIKKMACIPEYPATINDYYDCFSSTELMQISDHTIGLDLYRAAMPTVWEKHYKLKDSVGPAAGPFAITPEELKEIL